MFYGLTNAPTTLQDSLTMLTLNETSFPQQKNTLSTSRNSGAAKTPSGNQKRPGKGRKSNPRSAEDGPGDTAAGDDDGVQYGGHLNVSANEFDNVWTGLNSSESGLYSFLLLTVPIHDLSYRRFTITLS